jgi:hypothetical protein
MSACEFSRTVRLRAKAPHGRRPPPLSATVSIRCYYRSSCSNRIRRCSCSSRSNHASTATVSPLAHLRPRKPILVPRLESRPRVRPLLPHQPSVQQPLLRTRVEVCLEAVALDPRSDRHLGQNDPTAVASGQGAGKVIPPVRVKGREPATVPAPAVEAIFDGGWHSADAKGTTRQHQEAESSSRTMECVRRQLPWPKTTIILAGVMGIDSVTSSG